MKTVQRPYDDGLEYYKYLITVVAADEPATYYMTIYGIRTYVTTVHNKLEADKSKSITKEFTFTKTKIEAEPNEQYLYILVAKKNDVVELEYIFTNFQ